MYSKGMKFRPHNIEDKKVWSTAIYVRLSDEDRDKLSKVDLSRSIENQISFIESYIKFLNENSNSEYMVNVYGVYSDDDYTGMTFERPSFVRMMQDVKSGHIDCIIVKNFSRLGRHDNEMRRYLENDFDKPGKEVRFIAIGDNFDSLYDSVDVLVKFKLLMNQEYSETQHRNVIMGLRTMQDKGLFVGAFAPYGYKKSEQDKHKLVIDAPAAEVVKLIFKKYLEGLSPKQIAVELTNRGIPNPTAYKRLGGSNYRSGKKISDDEVHWRADGVKHILMDEVYIGVLVQHKRTKRKLTDEKMMKVPKEQWIRVENTHEPIIQKEDWDIAQSMMKTIIRDMTKSDSITIFKGLLKCGDCKHAMRKRWDTYESTRDGKVSKYLYYNCGTFRDYGSKGERKGVKVPKCTSHYISDNVIRKVVLSDINKIIAQVKNLESMVGNKKNNHSRTELMEKDIQMKKTQVDSLNKRLKNARNKWLDEQLSDDEFEEIRIDTSKEIEYLESQINLLEGALTNVSSVVQNQWVQCLLELGYLTELDRETVVTLIDAIYIYEDKHIEIVYKFSSEFDFLFDTTA